MSKQEEITKLQSQKEAILKAMKDPHLCEGTASLYSRVSGYYRNVSSMNIGKQQEIKDRKNFVI